MIVLKKIEMTLDPKSIEQAVKEIELFETKLKPAMQFLIDKLAEKGVEIARAHLLFFPKPAYDTGALSESVKYYLKDREATITAGEGLTNAMGEAQYGSYAMYVEYGNGYSRPNGWWYPDPNGWVESKSGKRFSFTHGMPPRPFMFRTYLDIATEAKVAGARIIAEYIADY